MRTRVQISLAALVLVPALAVGAFALARPHAARSHAVAFSDLRPVDERLFVDPAWDPATIRELEAILASSRARVAALFGSPVRATPIVIAVDASEHALRYMGNLHGAMHASPLASIVVLGPDGRGSVDVAAHELAHAEHFERAGWLGYTLAPLWFVEGLGMQVDHRPRYDDAAWARLTRDGEDAPRLDELEGAGFFTVGDLTANYAHSRREVAAWLERAGPGGLAELLGSWRFEDRYAAQ